MRILVALGDATTDMAALAQEVGGDKINVESIAKGYQDPHFVEAKPSFLLKLRQADLLIIVGLQLEIGWLPPLITQSGNPRIQVGAHRLSGRLAVCGDPGDTAGHGHARHGRCPPARKSSLLARSGQWAADRKGIANKLADLDPGDAAYFQQRFQDFDKRLSAAEQKWDAEMKPFRGRKVVTYHSSFPELRQAFRAECDRLCGAAAGHSADAQPHDRTDQPDEARKRQGDSGGALLRSETPQSIGRETGAQVVVYLPSVGGEKEVTTTFKLFDYDIGLLTKAFQATQYSKENHGDSSIFVWPFVASLILTGIHAYLGVHVVERGVIFVDLALAQIAALGATIAILVGMDPHGRGAYWLSLGFTFLGAAFLRSPARGAVTSRRKPLSASPMRWPRPPPFSP